MAAPSPNDYGKLLEGFKIAANDGDRLIASTFALASVIQFLQADDDPNSPDLIRPLVNLYSALHDTIQGGRPKFLFDPPRPECVTKPTNTFYAGLRGQLADTVRGLIEAGMKRREAAEWMCAHLSRKKITDPNGNKIRATQMLRWRDTVSDRTAPGIMRDAAEAASRLRKIALGPTPSVEAAKQHAESVVTAVHLFRIPRIPLSERE
jgi:hypothetical protein